MTKNKFLRMAISIALASVILAGMTVALAEQTGIENSDVEIIFEEGNGGVPPVDPDYPGEPLDPDEENPGEETGQSGPLALNYISSIRFGPKKILSVVEPYNAKTMRPFVQVTDLRGTGVGWRLTAKANPFTDSDGQPSLLGSVITLYNGEAVSANMELAAPVPAATVSLPTSGGHIENVVIANSGQGLGTWVTRWYPSDDSPQGENDSITLTVLPGTATRDTHKAKISWTLISDMST